MPGFLIKSLKSGSARKKLECARSQKMEKCWETLGQLVRVVMAAEGEKTSGTH